MSTVATTRATATVAASASRFGDWATLSSWDCTSERAPSGEALSASTRNIEDLSIGGGGGDFHGIGADDVHDDDARPGRDVIRRGVRRHGLVFDDPVLEREHHFP